jgi:NTP pyrophosphatase (non-canonical NTP hydrolase)
MIKDREQELYIVLQEEAAEVVQAVSKVFRFGKTESNIKDLEQEIGDFIGVLKLLDNEGYLDGEKLIKAAEKKIKKLDIYMTNKRKK